MPRFCLGPREGGLNALACEKPRRVNSAGKSEPKIMLLLFSFFPFLIVKKIVQDRSIAGNVPNVVNVF
jgi:hypothetical protein